MSNFFFSYSVFYLFGELSNFSIKFEIVVCKLVQFGSVKFLSFGKGLTFFLQNKLNFNNNNSYFQEIFAVTLPSYLTV